MQWTKVRRWPTTLGLPLLNDHGFAVNKLKGAVSKTEWSASSAFDSEKDKTAFRQYEDACERVKTFYREQHGSSQPSMMRFRRLTILGDPEKQTVEFNLRVRQNFKKTVRARMGTHQRQV